MIHLTMQLVNQIHISYILCITHSFVVETHSCGDTEDKFLLASNTQQICKQLIIKDLQVETCYWVFINSCKQLTTNFSSKGAIALMSNSFSFHIHARAQHLPRRTKQVQELTIQNTYAHSKLGPSRIHYQAWRFVPTSKAIRSSETCTGSAVYLWLRFRVFERIVFT